MNGYFGLVLIVIVVIIFVGGFAFLSWGRRPRSPGDTEAKADQEQAEHEERRRSDDS